MINATNKQFSRKQISEMINPVFQNLLRKVAIVKCLLNKSSSLCLVSCNKETTNGQLVDKVFDNSYKRLDLKFENFSVESFTSD